MEENITMWTGKEEASMTAGKPDQDLVLAGYMALAGSAVMTRQDRETLLTRLPEELIDQLLAFDSQRQAHKVMLQEPALKEAGATAWFPLGEGGIFNGLWHMADHWGTGFTVQLKDLPVRQETIEVCEFYDLSPYDLLCGNCMVFVADNGAHLVKELEKLDIPARTIGVVQKGIKREICYGQVRGFMDRPKKDEIYEIIDEEAVL